MYYYFIKRQVKIYSLKGYRLVVADTGHGTIAMTFNI